MPQTAETALEQTFSDLANARLRDKSPALLDYLVGFQLVKANEDGSRAVGIFGFEIGDSWYYAPVFFFNGELKGLDSIYGVDSDLFVPLNEDWVNQIINRKPNRIGEPDTKSRDERGVRLPNYNRLKQIPGGGIGFGVNGKFASANDFCEHLADKTQLNAKLAAVGMTVPEMLAEMGPAVQRGFAAELKTNAKLAQAVFRFYDPLDFLDIAVKTAVAKDPVTIITSVAQSGVEDLSDKQKEQLIVGGYAVVDKRPEMEKSIVYRNEARQCLQTVTDGGLYDVLMADGSVAELLVFKMLGGCDKYLVFDPSDGRHGLVEGKEIHTVRQHDAAAFRKALDSDSSSPDSVSPRDCVAFVNTNGESTLAFEIETARTGVNANKVLTVRGAYYLPSSWATSGGWSDGLPGSGSAIWRYEAPAQRIAEILVTDAGSGAIRYLNKSLVVNTKRFRALKLNRLVKKDGTDWYSPEKGFGEAHLTAKDLGDHNTVLAQLDKVASAIKVWSDGCETTIRDDEGTRNYTGVNALGRLIRKHGCSETDAAEILREARSQPVSYRIVRKTAAELLPFNDPQDTESGGSMSNFHDTKVPTRTVEKASPPSNREFYEYHSPFSGTGDENTQTTADTVSQASEDGQKEVFDASMLSALVKSHNPTEMVDRFLPTIVSGMDRQGRLLFLLNWHYEEFQERYGKDDLQEFTDDLKSNFESTGDLVIFMRKRTLAGDPEAAGLGLNSSMQG